MSQAMAMSVLLANQNLSEEPKQNKKDLDGKEA